jgi:hypothetical protein
VIDPLGAKTRHEGSRDPQKDPGIYERIQGSNCTKVLYKTRSLPIR